MQTGYSTLDLATLAIAIFVVWVSGRVPRKSTADTEPNIHPTDSPAH